MNLYVEMLFYRILMNEGVTGSHLMYKDALDKLWNLPLEERSAVILEAALTIG